MPFDPLTCFFVLRHMPADAYLHNNIGPVPFVLTRNPEGYTGETQDGAAKDLWFVEDGRRKADSIAAYWCPYQPDGMYYTVLGDACDWMFTATMDGCSFGVGHAAPDGSVIVGHANSAGLDQQGDKSAMIDDQRQHLEGLLGMDGTTILDPSGYRSRKTGWFSKAWDVSSTTFGVRVSGEWQFYTHRFLDGGQYKTYLETVRFR